MTLEQTIKQYALVLRQLLPPGMYDKAPNTIINDDVYAHAKALAQCDLDGKRLLNVLEAIPPELLEEYEREYGLPLKCQTNVRTFDERLELVRWIRSTKNVFNKTYLEQLLAIFNVQLVELVTFKPFKCISACNAPVNTEQLRYKVKLKLREPVLADMDCIIENYLPAFLRYDLEYV
ncbi:hypothetical protein F892_03126 [Acinetobacter vivianii]|uniref:DUF2313 domain-containing protein n=1 Tax=Acinetobacter vivianii TaxID=1776742 RepID=N9NGV4_9GAMM|nr:DUF2313 domain-containing protein [Acinetobacter vivianii]ENX20203.1 hypothetical protein F892_03126 [Acinetobacter vivianii]GGI59349.1 hypothetical protein GCM10011446_08440 [Acinetobacter vivianii]